MVARKVRHAKKRGSFHLADYLGLTAREHAVLRRLSTPYRIQAYLNATPINHEVGGETVLSVREVLGEASLSRLYRVDVRSTPAWRPHA